MASPAIEANTDATLWPVTLDQDAVQQLMLEFNDTIRPYSKEKTIHSLFEEQVLKSPDAIALCRHQLSMTYGELNRKANSLARCLISRGVKSGDNVALMVARSFDMVAGMLAIMKTGAAYVPIDPDYPVDRQEYILENSAVGLLIADNDYLLLETLPESRLVRLKQIDLNNFQDDNINAQIDSSQLAYTIYTSGSTGKPKGVMIEHQSAVNLLQWVNIEFSIVPQDCLLFITSMCFDLSVYDIFGLLAAGGSIVMVEKQELMDAPVLKDMLVKHKVTFWDSVPSTMDYFVSELGSANTSDFENHLRLVFMSGDWIPVNLPDRIKKVFPGARIISLGGATEGTVWSNFYPIDKVEAGWTSIPYGKPIANNFFYILDEQLKPVLPGAEGELYIGGVGVARGYANDAEKTAKAFIKDPFNSSLGGRMYKTGDYGRMLPGMNMEFIGRIDDQVKIRGFRIELGEITSVLQKHENVKSAVVLAKTVSGHEKELVAFFTGDAQIAALKAYLSEQLPPYMMPAHFVALDSIPLTGNGKVDKKALLQFASPSADEFTFYAAPRTNVEKMLADIWSEYLGLKKISIYDNFFELGGHSLIAVKVMTKIERLTGKRLPLASLFEKPTIERMARLLNLDATAITWDALVPIKTGGAKMPLYIVHGAGLNVLLFNAVAMGLSPDQPVYGLQAKGLNGIDEPLTRIEDMAAHYIDSILAQNPGGPYALAGFSFGGIIAYEMARQLQEMGREVNLVALFDTNAYNTIFYDPIGTKLRKQFSYYANNIVHTLKFVNGFSNTVVEKSTLLKRKVIRRYWSLTKKQDQPGFFGYSHKIDKCNQEALVRYQLKPQNIKVDVFKAETRTFYVKDTAFLGWRPFALNGVTVHNIPGEHNTIFKAPNDKIFAAELQKCLDRVSAEEQAFGMSAEQLISV